MKKLISGICILGLCLSLAACSAAETAEASLISEPETSVFENTIASETSATEATTTTTTVATTTEETTEPLPEPENISPEWVRALPEAQDESVTQMVIVAGESMDTEFCTVSMHERDENGFWVEILSTPGYVGWNGLILDEERYEGCGKTPIGRYYFTRAFGISPDPGCAIPYVQVTDDLYWSSDLGEGMHYNDMVSINDYPDLDTDRSEHLIEHDLAYQYCLSISFNVEGTLLRGSAIFLHCHGVNPYTYGCVSVPEDMMVEILQNVEPDCVVIIDTAEALGVNEG